MTQDQSPATTVGALTGDVSAKHTPGPWGVQDDHGRRYVETLQGNDDSICEVHKRGNKAEYAANARLIAAAPDGLDAAREALIALVAAPDSVAVQIARRKLNAFIAKATGGAA